MPFGCVGGAACTSPYDTFRKKFKKFDKLSENEQNLSVMV